MVEAIIRYEGTSSMRGEGQESPRVAWQGPYGVGSGLWLKNEATLRAYSTTSSKFEIGET